MEKMIGIDITLPEHLPARMLNEYTYCPRLGFLMWVESEFEENDFTIDGQRIHGRVDAHTEALEEADEEEEPLELPEEFEESRSVMLSSDEEGLIAKMDIVEKAGSFAIPVDYKRSKAPDIPELAYLPERVQLCAQGLILRDNGYRCDYGVLYFAGSKKRVEIAFDEDLVTITRAHRDSFIAMAKSGVRPDPLIDSPKCNGCSLVGICLPDETVFLNKQREPDEDGLRRLIPARADSLPLIVQEHGLYVGKSADELTVKQKGQIIARARLMNTSQVCLFGNVQMTAQALRECLSLSIPICHFSYGGYFIGLTHDIGLKNAELKRVQFRLADDEGASLALSKRFIEAKITNQRTLLRRNADAPDKEAMDGLKETLQSVAEADSVASLLGVEGYAAKLYFSQFSKMLKAKDKAVARFDFNGRNRRPPVDPVNAMLSFAYAMLSKDCLVTLMAVGFEPHQGFYHRPRFGRAALALDFMEEFRPIIADSVVLSLVNNGMVRPQDFIKVSKTVAMKKHARIALIKAYERRMDTLVTHPVFGYRISWRRVLEVQARLLARHLAGELEHFPPMTVR